MVERWQQSSEELLHEYREAESRIRRERAEIIDIVAELASRDAHSEVGYPNLPELLRDTSRITLREAKRLVRHADVLTETPMLSGSVAPAPLPATAAAVRDGVLGADHVDVIVKAVSGLPLHVSPAAIAEAEQTLVAAAASMDARTLSRVGDRVRLMLDQDGAPPSDAELANPINELHLMTRSNGRTAFRGELAPEASALFRTLLSPLAKPRPSGEEGPDQRTPAERNGDALADLLQLAADNADLPGEAGEKPHLLVTIPLAALRNGLGTALLDRTSNPTAAGRLDFTAAGHHAWAGGLGSTAAGQLAWAGDLDAASARRLACDAKIIPAVLGSNSEPLDLGRASYTVSTALRRALVLRGRRLRLSWLPSPTWLVPQPSRDALGGRRKHRPRQPRPPVWAPPPSYPPLGLAMHH